MTEVNRELEQPEVWQQPERAQALGKERAQLENSVKVLQRLHTGLSDAIDLVQMAKEEDDESLFAEVSAETAVLAKELEQLEFQRMFSGEMDPNNAYLDIQAGSGGDRSAGLG